MAQQKRIRVVFMVPLHGLRILHCRELWCRLQMQLGSHVAVAVVEASSYSSNSTPSLGTATCRPCIPKKKSIKKMQIVPDQFNIPDYKRSRNPWRGPLGGKHPEDQLRFTELKPEVRIIFSWGVCQHQAKNLAGVVFPPGYSE